MSADDVTIGSRWYAWGHHHQVVELGHVDGDPAVRLRADGQRGADPCMVRVDNLLRHGVPSTGPAPVAAANTNTSKAKARTTRAPSPQPTRRPQPAAATTQEESTMARSNKLSAREAIEKVLRDAGKPMRVPEIIEKAVPLTALKGATPGQTIYSVLYADVKKQGTVFKKVGRGEFAIKPGAPVGGTTSANGASAARPQAKPDPKPTRSRAKPKSRKSRAGTKPKPKPRARARTAAASTKRRSTTTSRKRSR